MRAVKAGRSSPAGEALMARSMPTTQSTRNPARGSYLPVVSVPFGLLV
jgi:hypothetical protein